MTNLVNITSTEKNLTVSIRNNSIALDLMSTEDNIYDHKGFERIIKNSESLIRKSHCYDIIKSTLINKYGLNYCMYYRNITTDVQKIEMHHGPIFTLYDLCEIAATVLLKTNNPLTVFRIKRLVLYWHTENMVYLMMLSKNVHEAVHLKPSKDNPSLKPMFLDHRSAFGDFSKFVLKYSNYFNYRHITKIKKYFDEYSELTSSDDPSSMFFKEVLKKWY